MITLSQTGGTSGITTITISATSRSEMSDFVKKYTLANQNKSTLLAVTQKGYVPSGKYISFKPDSFSFDSSGGTGSLQVTSNDDWYIDFGSWVYPNEMRGNGNTIIGIRVEANTGSTRSGNITGYCLSDSAETASASVSQVGSYVKPYLSVSPLRTPVIASGGTGFTLAVTSNQEWNAYTDARWVTINTVSGSGNGNVSFDVVENATDIAREANIYVVSSASSLSATSVIAQSAQTHQEPYLVISPSAKTMSTSGGSFTITVSSNTEWETAVVYGGQVRSWIALDKLNGYGDDVVEARIEPDVQESISGRSAYISFFNNKEGLKTECNITQREINTTKVYYTTTGDTVFSGVVTGGWGANIVSNTYSDGQGIIEFDGPVKSIPNSAFETGDTTLSSIVLPEAIETIGNSAFAGCNNLTGSVVIPDSVETLGAGAFSSCRKLTYVSFGDIDNIGNNSVFANCKSLTGVSMGNITGITYQMFYSCTGLTSVTIPSTVTSIGGQAFYECSGLTMVSVPDSVTTIGSQAFKYCGLSRIDIGSGFTGTFTEGDFDGNGFTSIYLRMPTFPSGAGSCYAIKRGSTHNGVLHYPSGSESSYKNLISVLNSGNYSWTAIADL